MDKVDDMKRQLKDIATLRDHSKTISRLQREIERAGQEAKDLESDLSTTGSTRTADDVQEELDRLSGELWAWNHIAHEIVFTIICSRSIEKEKFHAIQDRERQNAAIRSIETSLHAMELNERDLNNEIRERSNLEERIEAMRQEIAVFTNKMKVS